MRAGCFVRNAFEILRMVATARYLHLKSQELHEALKEVHVIIGEEADERVRLREEIPAIDARLAEWDAGQLRDQIGLIQQDFARTHRSLGPDPRASGGPGRSVEGGRSGGARGFGPLQPADYKPR